MISIQTQDFNAGEEYQALCQHPQTGAVVTFVGQVRDFNDGQALWLEHYPPMTQQVLERLKDSACRRWPLHKVRIIHRIGPLPPSAQIVFVGVSSAHRHSAFEACAWLMDMLKTQAPFWKKEGQHWVDAKAQDQAAALRWLKRAPEDTAET